MSYIPLKQRKTDVFEKARQVAAPFFTPMGEAPTPTEMERAGIPLVYRPKLFEKIPEKKEEIIRKPTFWEKRVMTPIARFLGAEKIDIERIEREERLKEAGYTEEQRKFIRALPTESQIMVGVIGATQPLKPLSIAQANKLIANANKLNWQDISNITAGRIISGPKYSAFKIIAQDKNLLKAALARKGKITFGQTIKELTDDVLRQSKEFVQKFKRQPSQGEIKLLGNGKVVAEPITKAVGVTPKVPTIAKLVLPTTKSIPTAPITPEKGITPAKPAIKTEIRKVDHLGKTADAIDYTINGKYKGTAIIESATGKTGDVVLLRLENMPRGEQIVTGGDLETAQSQEFIDKYVTPEIQAVKKPRVSIIDKAKAQGYKITDISNTKLGQEKGFVYRIQKGMDKMFAKNEAEIADLITPIKAVKKPGVISEEIIKTLKADDVSIMERFIDDIRLRKVSPETEIQARDLLKGVGISPEKTNAQIIPIFEDALQRYGKVERQIIPPSPPPTEIPQMAAKPVGDPVVKLNELLKRAKPLRGRLETKFTQERAKRIRAVERAIENIGGEQGYIVALSKLKGELAPTTAKTRFEPLKEQLSKEELNALYNRIFKHSYLDNWEKVSAANEFTNLLRGELPTPKGLTLLEEIYGTELIKNVLAKRAAGLKIADTLLEIANIPRSILATADMSAFLRQGIIPVIAHPKIAAKAMRKTFKFAFNQKAFEQYFKDLSKDPLYQLMRKSKLAITDPARVGLTGREEAFISRLMQKVPVFGEVIKFAERAYVGFLNKLRVDIFKTFADEFLSKGYSPIKDIELFKSAARVVNTFTGRGDIGALNRITPHLNAIFFSPRLISARFNALNPIWYAKQSPLIRKKAIGDFAKFVVTGLTIVGLVSLWDEVDVETNPRSSDFGKIKIGNTRWDIWAGFQQWVRVMAQVISGERKSTKTGEIVSLTKDEYPFTTRKETMLRFIEGKLAPIPALINQLVSGAKTFEGEDITPEIVAKEKFIPMYIQDIAEAYEEGGLGRATGAGIPAFFGIGVQTWGQKKSILEKYEERIKRIEKKVKLQEYEKRVKKIQEKYKF